MKQFMQFYADISIILTHSFPWSRLPWCMLHCLYLNHTTTQNKHAISCQAQLTWKCTFMPTLFTGWF